MAIAIEKEVLLLQPTQDNIGELPFLRQFREIDVRTWSGVNDRLLVAKSWPTMDDLPSENPEDEGMDEFHRLQSNVLSEGAPSDIFTAAEMHIYFDLNNPKWYKRPDWFMVLDVPKLYPVKEMRSSYVVWDEGVVPFIAIELLSPSTEAEDLGKTVQKKGEPPTKWMVYEKILGIPYYVIFSRYTDKLKVFQISNSKYQQVTLPDNRLWLPNINHGLGLWKGAYDGKNRLWLRWYDKNGWVPLLAERARRERQTKEVAQRQVEQERQAKEVAQRQVEQERQAKEVAQRQVEQERQLAQRQVEVAQRQVEQERQLAQQQVEVAQRQLEQERCLTARKMLADGLNLMLVAKYTGLSPDELACLGN